jgi:glycosyltransferase involved in cell wall biosynthesis
MTRFGLISTYPPTICGLATFTRSLARALSAPSGSTSIVQVLDDDDVQAVTAHDDRNRIVGVIRRGDVSSQRAAARALRSCDVVILQHEYGIYGGDDGEEVLDILTALDVPTIAVLHTVLAAPSPNQRRVLERVIEMTTAVVVMTHHAFETLIANYDVDQRRVNVIPHGVPEPSAHLLHRPNDVARVLTWGLLSPGKGLERGIRAFALAHMRGLDAEYVIAGQTHPKYRAHSGETYRESLVGLARALGVSDAVHFLDRYLTDEDLAGLLDSADLVLLPYESREQATSGVLVEAVAAGVPVVSTAFPHAVELLADGAGRAVPHDDLAGMAHAIEEVLSEEQARGQVQRPGDRVSLTWPQVAARYGALATRLRSEQAA